MRNEQTSLNIGRIKTFDELMDEVLSQQDCPATTDEEEYAKLEKMFAMYKVLYGSFFSGTFKLEDILDNNRLSASSSNAKSR